MPASPLDISVDTACTSASYVAALLTSLGTKVKDECEWVSSLALCRTPLQSRLKQPARLTDTWLLESHMTNSLTPGEFSSAKFQCYTPAPAPEFYNFNRQATLAALQAFDDCKRWCA